MANVQRDENRVTGLLAESSAGDDTTIPLEANPTTNRLRVESTATIVETVPDDPTKNNPSFTLSYTGDNLTQVDMVIGGVTYRKTLSYTGTDLTGVSAWVEQ